jgi:hypothetical protein
VECAAADWQEFEAYWRGIDPYFGRFICWISFSAGAELLIKGVCLAHRVDVGHRPQSFGTLDGTLKRLGALFEMVEEAGTAEQRLVRTAYEKLKKIRDRDVHAYWPHVRNTDFNLVVEVFVPCFNIMMSWLPDGSRMSDAELGMLLSQ